VLIKASRSANATNVPKIKNFAPHDRSRLFNRLLDADNWCECPFPLSGSGNHTVRFPPVLVIRHPANQTTRTAALGEAYNRLNVAKWRKAAEAVRLPMSAFGAV
jgi:hypothetical protein